MNKQCSHEKTHCNIRKADVFTTNYKNRFGANKGRTYENYLPGFAVGIDHIGKSYLTRDFVFCIQILFPATSFLTCF